MSEPPVWSYPRAAAQLAVSEGMSGEDSYAVLSSLGMQISREQYLGLYGQARDAAASQGATEGWGIDEYPTSEIIQPLTTVTSTGFLTQLSVNAVDDESGQTLTIPYSVKTDTPISPGEAVDAAVAAQTIRASDYRFTVVGATVTGIYRLTPQEEAA